MKKTILGLDLGVTSIGWALIASENDTPKEIKGMGVRIIPLSPDENDEFTKGNAISKNRERTIKRTQRKGLDRYQLRRKALINVLQEHGMMPEKKLLLYLSPLEIWGLRAKAVKEKISLQELGRVLLHMNQKRGYKHSKIEDSEDEKKQTEYVTEINNRYDFIRSKGMTIGELFYKGLKDFDSLKKEWSEVALEPIFRTKEKVFPRAAYESEFSIIWKTQANYYPNVLTDELFDRIKNEIIYYQRKLKSQKGLVSFCEFEKKSYATKEQKIIEAGPRVAPRSSPLFQVCKLWESINNITIKNRKGELFPITIEHKISVFEYLDHNEKLTQAELFNLLGISKNAGYFTNTQIRKTGIKGNTTKKPLIDIIGVDHSALKFNLIVNDSVNKQTGEVFQQVSDKFEKEPLYLLWHIIYSLSHDEESCIKKLTSTFNIDQETAKKLTSIDFSKGGFGNKSAKAIRKMLPFLMKGEGYSKACSLAGYNHSNSLTTEEKIARPLLEALAPLKKNSLRQPVVEKILNQMINLVNALIEKYGKPYEIRVELARELKQSREERNDAYNNINKRERENDRIRKILLEHPEFKKKIVSKRDIERYRLWTEFGNVSPYEPSKVVNISELYNGNYEIEHIIPKALRFDDSFSNKTICPRKFNSGDDGKNRKTAYDYMSNKRSQPEFETYLEFIERAYKDKRISKTKYENLLLSEYNLKEGFIERQLRETQYISRKAREILSNICHEVHATSGTITQRLRQLWGWEEILENLNLPKYKSLGLTEVIEFEHNGHKRKRDKIKDWSKRDDHRHHAIDALTVACTRQGFIQRLNTLNTQHTREQMYKEVQEYKDKISLLDNYLLQYKPFDTYSIEKVLSEVVISFKPGKKVATYSRRIHKKGNVKKIIQKNIIEPRGALSEESVYGKIKRKIKRKAKLDSNFSDIEKVIDNEIKEILYDHLSKFENNPAIAFKNLKKEPIWLNADKTACIKEVEIEDYVDEYVIKYPVSNITVKDLEYIVDARIKEVVTERLKLYNDNPKEAFKDLMNNPIWFNKEKNIPVKSVRCYTGIKKDSIAAIKVFDESWGIEYEKYVKTGNNHHIALYQNENGKLVEHVVTFWHAVERKKYGIPVIIKDPAMVWDDIFNNREFSEDFLELLPQDKWKYVTSLQQNETFVFNTSKDELQDLIQKNEYSSITPNIFRVRKITSGAYWFNHQYETTPRESVTDKKAGRCVQASLSSMNGIKVKINNMGEIFIVD